MKRLKSLLLIIFLFIITLFVSCKKENETVYTDKNILIAYFSVTGNTLEVSNNLHQSIDGSTLFEIVPKEKYTDDDINYNDDNSRVSIENSDSSIRPEIENKIENISDYDIIFLGYPIWYGTCPKIILTFIESYDFENIQIIPYCTSGGSSITRSVETIKEKASNATVLDGVRVRNNDISELLSKIE